MGLFKIVKKFLCGFIGVAGLVGAWFIAPAAAVSGTDSDGWKVVVSFGKAVGDIRDRTENNLGIYVVLLFLLVVFIVYLYWAQKKIDSEKTITGVSSEGNSGRRAFIRLTIEQELYYARALEKTYRKARVVNLSGGGMLFATNEEIPIGEELKIVMELFPEVVIRLRACVIWQDERADQKDKDEFMLGLHFKDINNADQDKIVKRVLREQQETIIEEKRKLNNQCVFCGETLPEESIGVRIFCPNCIVYEDDNTPQ